MARILIVDDDPLIRDLIPLVLREQGHEVTTAADGGLALREVQEAVPDLVLTDMLMPETDGLELMRDLRRDYPGLRIIAMTGGSRHLAGADLLRVAKHLGAHAVLSKPFGVEQLIAAVTQVLEAP